MKIRDIFSKDVSREIDGVIKANDEKRLKTEAEEYVITGEIFPQFQQLVDAYLNSEVTNAFWISGFFGSGKSHFLKMLALLSENRDLGGTTVLDIFREKPEIADDQLFLADLEKLSLTPSKAILFNIDQKAYNGRNEDDALLSVFTKVLNEAQGFYRKQEFIAAFERDLAKDGKYEDFKAAYEAHSGCTWNDDLDKISRIKNATFAKVYADFFNEPEEEGLKLFDRYRKDYRVSVEDFVEWVREYIDSQGPDFRLNFFVDEVGQFIGRNSKLMLKLQTIAEDLAVGCDGRACLFVTSQGDLHSVLGDMGNVDDFSKIKARFAPINFTSANVSEVIQKRLLAKTDESTPALESLYESEKENLRTLFSFGDGSRDFAGFSDARSFVNSTPFHPYQFELFQDSIVTFSRHEMFTGKHQSVGERSMLAVFHQVAKQIADAPFDTFGTFDQMFDGLSKDIRPQLQSGINRASDALSAGHPLAVKILKCLFLLKHVTQFKSTTRNVAILLIDSPQVDIAAHEDAIKTELNYLYSQSYVQKNGEAFEYLTDIEKDVEVEIKSTQVGEDKINKVLEKTLFGDVIRDSKFRYEANNQDYPFSRRLDGANYGREYDVAIHIITAGHDNAGDLPTLMAQNTGKRELLCVLPNEPAILDEAKLFEQTELYAQTQSSSQLSPERQAIIRDRRTQNSLRRSKITELAKDLISRAEFVLNGSKIEVSGTEPKVRVHNAFQDLVSQFYPNLRMLKTEYKEAMIPQIIREQNDLIAEPLSEAEQEVLTFLNRKKMESKRADISEILGNFRYGNYGWPDVATLCLLARLFRRPKIEFMQGSEILDSEDSIAALTNTNLHGGVKVQVQEEFDITIITAVKTFHHEFFHVSNPGTDAKSVATELLTKMADEANELDTLIARKAEFPFTSALGPVRDRLNEIAKRDYTYPLKSLKEFDDDLLDARDDLIDRIKSFVNGANGGNYLDICNFLRDQAGNLPAGDERVTLLRDVAQSTSPFRGGAMPSAVAALSQLKIEISAAVAQAKADAVTEIQEREKEVIAHQNFAQLTPEQQDQVLGQSATVIKAIESSDSLPVISNSVTNYENKGFASQLSAVAALAPASPSGQTVGEKTYVNINQCVSKAKQGKAYLETEEDVTAFVTSLEAQLKSNLKEGKGITL